MDPRIQVIQGDITSLEVDAIVNAANSALTGGGGVDHAIHKAAGPQFTEACRLLRGCATGMAKIVPGFGLKAKHVILTVGPVWNNGVNNEEELLASCYQESLKLMVENQLESIVFPSISTGAYRFPFEKAVRISLDEINRFLLTNTSLKKVLLVAYSNSDFKLMTKTYNKY